MDSYYRSTWVEISLDNLRHNLMEFRRVIPESMKLMAVIKADAYGHGAEEVAQEALASGVDYLGVSLLDEALQLRKAGISCPILVFSYIPPEAVRIAIEQDVTLTVYSEEILHRIQREYRGKPARIHIKLDTGMGRLGIYDEEEAVRFIERASEMKEVVIEGLYTHYARADEEDDAYTIQQYEKFLRIIQRLEKDGLSFALNHAGNSATGIQWPHLGMGMIRLGISMYGCYPSEELHGKTVELRPVMSFKTKIVHLKTLPVHSGISYGTTYWTKKNEEKIATLPVGYGDGYSRMLSGKATVLVRGRMVPVVGRICMDHCMISVSDIPDVAVGDEVVLFGEQEGNQLPVDLLAKHLQTINYEVLCMVANRVPRVYLREGKPVKVVNRLL